LQAPAAMLLASVEREKELLRVFLKVSQMENKILRRMNLSSFLMVSLSFLIHKDIQHIRRICAVFGALQWAQKVWRVSVKTTYVG
jgi:hypothetical protein